MDSDEDTGMESMNELIPNEYKGIIERIIRDCEAISEFPNCRKNNNINAVTIINDT